MIIYIIYRVPQADKGLLVQEAQRYLSSELQGDIMTIAQQWEAAGMQKGMQQGMQKGVQQGLRKGVQEGEAAMLMRQLILRFGDLPKHISQQITHADAHTLLVWGEKVLDATHLEDIFRE